MNTEVLLDKLAKAVSFKFKDDQTSPGITVSLLKKGYYCSVVRYNGSFAKGKVVVCKAEANTLNDALKGLAVAFLIAADTKPDPVQDLNNLLVQGA